MGQRAQEGLALNLLLFFKLLSGSVLTLTVECRLVMACVCSAGRSLPVLALSIPSVCMHFVVELYIVPENHKRPAAEGDPTEPT